MFVEDVISEKSGPGKRYSGIDTTNASKHHKSSDIVKLLV